MTAFGHRLKITSAALSGNVAGTIRA